MRIALLHIVAKALGVSFRIDGVRYGRASPIKPGDSC